MELVRIVRKSLLCIVCLFIAMICIAFIRLIIIRIVKCISITRRLSQIIIILKMIT